MDPIRTATPEEIEVIKDGADLYPGLTTVLKYGDLTGVLRNCTEFDPLISAPGTPLSRKVQFTWGIETFLRLTGTPFYYFNVDVNDEHWIANVKHWGAIQVSQTPELRFKKLL
jgi:hypothetical protein